MLDVRTGKCSVCLHKASEAASPVGYALAVSAILMKGFDGREVRIVKLASGYLCLSSKHVYGATMSNKHTDERSCSSGGVGHDLSCEAHQMREV